jgi:hypothetical protein
MKYKNMAAVKRLAATELRKSGSPGLADEVYIWIYVHMYIYVIVYMIYVCKYTHI